MSYENLSLMELKDLLISEQDRVIRLLQSQIDCYKLLLSSKKPAELVLMVDAQVVKPMEDLV